MRLIDHVEDEDLVQFLRLRLKEAEQGELLGIAMVGIRKRGRACFGWSGLINGTLLRTVGLLLLLIFELLDMASTRLSPRE